MKFSEIKMMTISFIALLIVLSHSFDVKALRPRELAPEFNAKAVIDDRFIDISLASIKESGKWSVLLFYPFDFVSSAIAIAIAISPTYHIVLLDFRMSY